jgi:O-antigen ligase
MDGITGREGHRIAAPGERFFLPLLLGLIFGFFVLSIFRLPMKFTYYFIAGPIILFVAIISGNLKRFFQGILIFIIPINYATHFFRREYEFGGGGGLSFSPLDIVLIVLYGIWLYELIFRKASREVHFFPRVAVPALVLVAYSFFSMIPAQDPYMVLFENINVLRAIFLFIYIGNHVRTRKDLNRVVFILLLSLFLQSVVAMAQRWLGISLGLQLFGEYAEVYTFKLDYYLTTARVGGTIGHPNALAKYVEMLIPLSMVLLFTRIRSKYKIMSMITFVAALVVLLLTLSRGGWVCFTGSIALVLLLIFRARLISLRTLVAILLIGVIFAGVGAGFSGMVQSRLFGDDYGAAKGRMPLNRIAINVIRHHPIFGVGLKNYGKVMHLYNPNIERMRTNMVHNAYLLIAAEAGIPGLLLMLWLLGAILKMGLENINRKQDVFLKSLNIGIVAGLAALLAHWLVDIGYIGRFAVFWVLAGLLAASQHMEDHETAAATEM